MCGGFSAPAVSYCGVRAANFRHIAHREHVIALEPLGKGLLGTTLRYDYEVRDEKDYFSGVPSPKISKDMVNLAAHILKTKETKFDPRKFKDEYEQALKKLIRRKA